MAVNISVEQIWNILEAVTDPEIPVLTVTDLGIIRDVKLEDGQVEVVITPTYSGCPAMNTIEINIRSVLEDAGFANVKVSTILHPAWTTDWISPKGRQRLLEYGIAPPAEHSVDKNALFQESPEIACPQCKSVNTEMISQFGSTACKSLYRCLDCKEPFDYFKCH